MADNKDILQEFLVRLGYTVDESSFKKFMGIIGVSDSGLADLAVSAGAATVALTTMVQRVADRIERLYYVGQASGETINTLQGVGYAAEMIGVSAEKAQSRIAGLAMSIKTNPGLGGLLGLLGVNITGKPAEVFSSLIHRLKAMPFFMASQYAQQFGISPDELMQFENNIDKYDAAQRRYAEIQRQFGVDNDRNSEGFIHFKNTLTDIVDKLEAVGEKIAGDFLPPAQKVLDWVDQAVTEFGQLNKETDSWLGLLTAIGTAVGGGLLGKSLLGSIFGRGAAAVGAGAAAGGAGEAAAAGGLGLGLLGMLRFLGLAGAVGTTVYYAGGFNNKTAGPEDDEINPNTGEPRGQPYPDLPRGLRNNNPGNLKWPSGTHDKEGFSIFSSPGVGIGMMTAQLRRNYVKGLDTIQKMFEGSGVFKGWLGGTPGQSTQESRDYIDAVTKLSGFSAGQRLDLNNRDTILAIEKAMIRHENGYNPFEDRVMKTYIGNEMEQFGPTGQKIEINDNSKIEINGSASPEQTGKAVLDAKSRSYQDLIRHFTPRNRQ
jgi:hypothetical protein